MGDVVRSVSQSDEARAAGIELQPLLWEDLPPGQAQAGDLQSRVNALLDQYDLKRYEIYAGAMKDRLGTPTAKFRSGTIEELETAIAGHRRAQIPAEVLFYLIGPGSDEVRAFRDELTARVTEATQRFHRDDLLARLEAAGVPAGPINTVAQAFADPQVRHRQMALTIEREGGAVPGVRTPIRFSDADLVLDRPAPPLPR